MTIFELTQSAWGDIIPLYGFKLKGGYLLWQAGGYNGGNKLCTISRFTKDGIVVRYINQDTEIEIIESPKK